MTGRALADIAVKATRNVNGPEDEYLNWDVIDWRTIEDDVRRLRQRIFTASQAGDLAQVRNLQKLMLRSRSNTLLSVRQVTERNAGRATAGIDGQIALTSADRAKLAMRVHRPPQPWNQPVCWSGSGGFVVAEVISGAWGRARRELSVVRR